MKNCNNCGLPETYETFEFDDKQICNVCNQHKTKNEKVDWEKREKIFNEIIDNFRGKGDYDCIVPFSGGKDSTYVLYQVVTKHKLKPLVISFDHGFYRLNHLQNVEQTLKFLGVDYHLFKPNMKVVGKTMLESLKRKGDFCWHCHCGVFAYPMSMSVKLNIPLIIWGESVAEYTGYYDFEEGKWEMQDEEAFNRHINLGISAEDMAGFLGSDITERDLRPYQYPKLSDLKKIGYQSIQYGTFFKWDSFQNAEVIKREIGWKQDEVEGLPDEFSYEKLECRINGVRDWIKYIKRGFGRTAQSVAREIRNGRMNLEEGKKLINKNDGKRPASLDYFLKILNIDEKEFLSIVKQHQISPWEFNDKNIQKGEKLHDQNSWNDTILIDKKK
jgi:N-acetyl sugar amidotransferase